MQLIDLRSLSNHHYMAILSTRLVRYSIKAREHSPYGQVSLHGLFGFTTYV